jgi:hypothetical protein
MICQFSRTTFGCPQVSDGYFVHFFAPTDLQPLPKHAIFVLDISGSMYGRKVEQLKQAMATILSDLNQADFFSIVLFESGIKVTTVR